MALLPHAWYHARYNACTNAGLVVAGLVCLIVCNFISNFTYHAGFQMGVDERCTSPPNLLTKFQVSTTPVSRWYLLKTTFKKIFFHSSLHSPMKIIRVDSLKLMVAYGKYASADNSFNNIEQTTPTSNKLPLPSSLAAVLMSLCWLADAFCTLGGQLQASWGRTNLHQFPNVAFSDSSYHSILFNKNLTSVQTLNLIKILWLENKATQN